MTWWKRPTPDVKIDELIKPLVIKFTGCDEALRERTAQRRLAAERIRQRAQRVESGSPVREVLTLVRKQW